MKAIVSLQEFFKTHKPDDGEKMENLQHQLNAALGKERRAQDVAESVHI